MFLINKEEQLTPIILGRIISDFQTKELPNLKKYRKYYEGKQAILNKEPTDVGKPCNKIVVNYCYSIVQNYLGYLTGIPITYSNEDFDDIIDILKYNDVTNEDSLLLKNALIYGKAFEVNYIDENAKQRFKVLDTEECIPVYDDTLNGDLLYVIRCWKESLSDNISDEKYFVEVYGPGEVKKYKSTSEFASLELIEEKEHFYGQCPVTVFELNSDKVSIFDKVITLQDGYNSLISDEVDDFDAFADAYLILKGAMPDKDDLKEMKQNRVLVMDTDASADYLTKSISDTQIQNMLDNFNKQIHKISNSPDFSDENLMAQSGIAMRYKLVGFENAASSIESFMRKALQRRIELISSILAKTDDEEMWRDVDIHFTRNLPISLEESANVVNNLRGIVSTETLLKLLPFVDDVQAELERLKAEKEENMSLYSFQNNVNNNEEDEEDEELLAK